MLAVSGWLPSASLRFSGTRRSLGCRWSPACTRCSSRWPCSPSRFLTSPRRLRGLRHRGPARRNPGRARGRGVGKIRSAGRARGPARWRAAAAGAARVRGEFPFPHRPDRVPRRRRYPGSRRQLPDILGVSATGQNTLAILLGTVRALPHVNRTDLAVSAGVIVMVLAARLVNPQDSWAHDRGDSRHHREPGRGPGRTRRGRPRRGPRGLPHLGTAAPGDCRTWDCPPSAGTTPPR